MSKTVGIVIAVTIAFYRRESGGEGAPATGKGCVSVPLDFIGWSGSFLSTDWGAYGAARQQYLGLDPDDEAQRHFVDGFFKAIGVEPRSSYVKHFEREIKAYITSTSALPHWEIPVSGYMRC